MKNSALIGLAIAWTAAGVFLYGCAHHRPAPVYEQVRFSTEIDAKVQRLLEADPLLKGHNLKVNTFQGEVKLDGVVETEEQRQQATKLVWGVPDVRGVENNLLLESEKAR